MKRYIVDLRSCPESECNRIYQLLSDWAYTSPFASSSQNVYFVDWDWKETIESVTGLPSSAVTLQE